METVIAEVRGGLISPRAANALGYLINIRLHCLPVESVPAPPEERSERFKALLGRVIENSIKKAKAYGGENDLPEDLKPLAAALDEAEAREP